MKAIFKSQLPSGQIPTLMLNETEGIAKKVDTLAITMMAVYLAQLNPQWKVLWGFEIERALKFIESRAYIHEIEGFRVWHFNAFYPPDWEDTAMAVYLLMKNGRFEVSQCERLRDLLIQNSVHENGTGVWIKDPYSEENASSNVWDPTSTLNILRLHYLFETGTITRKVEKFLRRNLELERFSKVTLYYTAPLAAFFAKRLVEDFFDETSKIRKEIEAFVVDVKAAIISGRLAATIFEKVLLGISARGLRNSGLIFHHGRRNSIWYGSPVLFKLAREIL